MMANVWCGPRLGCTTIVTFERVGCALALKKENHLSASRPRGWKRFSFWKVFDGDKPERTGSPFLVPHVVSSGSCMMCRMAASVNGTDVITVVREDPHRRMVEERATVRLVKIGSFGIGTATLRVRREGARNSAITEARSAKTSISDRRHLNENSVK